MQPPHTRLFILITAALASREGGSTLTRALTWSWVTVPHFLPMPGMSPIPNTNTNVVGVGVIVDPIQFVKFACNFTIFNVRESGGPLDRSKQVRLVLARDVRACRGERITRSETITITTTTFKDEADCIKEELQDLMI